MTTAEQLHQITLVADTPFELRVDQSKHVPEREMHEAIASGEIGFVHSFTTGSAVDGPGLRVVAWLSGCHWRCMYCHNPDTWNMRNGIPVPISRAADALRKYGYGLAQMKGGLTISGGEPLLQNKFVMKLFRAARAMKVHTTLDTNGHLGERLSDEELDLVDLVLLDLKAWDSEKHQRLTGAENGPVLDFARRLAEHRRPVWIRYVLVPGLTDDREEIAHIAEFAGTLGNVERVDVLPFHQMGAYKWKNLGLDYQLKTFVPPSRELVESVCEQFKAAGLNAS